MNYSEAIEIAVEAIRHRPDGCDEPVRDGAAIAALRDLTRFLNLGPDDQPATPQPPQAAPDETVSDSLRDVVWDALNHSPVHALVTIEHVEELTEHLLPRLREYVDQQRPGG